MQTKSPEENKNTHSSQMWAKLCSSVEDMQVYQQQANVGNYELTCVCLGIGIKSMFKQKNAVYLARLWGAFETFHR